MKARERFLRLVIDILGRPYRYTKRELVEKYCDSPISKCLDEDFRILRALDLLTYEVRRGRYVYAIVPSAEFAELQQLQALSDTELAEIRHHLRALPERRRRSLMQKLESVLNFQKLGLEALRKPNLEKLDLLTAGQRHQRAVLLKNYQSSNSNTVRDRLVEPFHIDSELDTLQAFQIDPEQSERNQRNRHFRLSRIERVELTERPWQFADRHRVERTDVFRIVNDSQEFIHLTLTTRARNELLEKFPSARSEIRLNSDGKTYDFQTMANADFYGLLPFVLGNYDQVEVLEPEKLRVAVRQAGMAMGRRFG